MDNRPMTSGGGLSNSKLALATATPADVPTGVTFYAGDKTLKTGTGFTASSGNKETNGGSQDIRRDESNRVASANTYMKVNVSVSGRKVIVSAYAHFHVNQNNAGGLTVGTGDYSGCSLNFEIPF